MSNFQMLFMIISNQLEREKKTKENKTQNMTGLPAAGTRGTAVDPFPPTPMRGTFQEGFGLQGLQITPGCAVYLDHPVLPEGLLK